MFSKKPSVVNLNRVVVVLPTLANVFSTHFVQQQYRNPHNASQCCDGNQQTFATSNYVLFSMTNLVQHQGDYPNWTGHHYNDKEEDFEKREIGGICIQSLTELINRKKMK